MNTAVPRTDPILLAQDTYLITNMMPLGPGEYLPVNSMLIRGAEPVIVDTGAPVHRELWLEQVFGLGRPRGRPLGLPLPRRRRPHRSPAPTCSTWPRTPPWSSTSSATERARPGEAGAAPHRMIWREPTEWFDAGDRRLRLIRPPIFDGPTTRACTTSGPA